MKFREVLELKNRTWYFVNFEDLHNGSIFCFADAPTEIYQATSDPVPISDYDGEHRGNMSIQRKCYFMEC